MTIYDFEAIENYEGSRAVTRWKLEGTSFADACLTAQINEMNDALENDREPDIYDEFKQIKR